MEAQDVFLPELDISVLITIERKKIKNSRLKVFPDKTIKFSVPEVVSEEWITKYLDKNKSWISKKLKAFEKTRGYAATTEIRDGFSVRFLGEDLIFVVIPANKRAVYKEGKRIYIKALDVNRQDLLISQFERWWRKESLRVINSQLENLYPIIEKYKIAKPEVKLRRMKTLWGSCSPHRGIITFNQYLTKATPACIEYVVLHELVHFLYPNHSKKFYYFLGTHMPDWKERKKVIDQDVVHGL
ncbi:MAG TPA: SprT family zinc-dependent metalloprotease [Paludibacter sp.]|nr:SprT family zinc-dependent metalloprotease [Paludibacter sp.]